VLRVARIVCGNAAEAEDLAQDTMLKAFRSIDSFADGTDVRAWLMTILRNTRIDRLRSKAAAGKQVGLDEVGVEPPAEADAAEWYQFGDSPEEILQEFSDQQVIDALRSLPDEIRWTLLLVDVEGMDHKDAAGVLDVPVGTVKSRAHRGRQMLRQVLLPLAKRSRLARR
jgi:RNA polymerase sigma-70 factor (ECF subfamily)